MLKTQIESVFLDSHQSQLRVYEQIIDCLLLNRFSVGNTEHSLGKQGRIQGFLIGGAGGGVQLLGQKGLLNFFEANYLLSSVAKMQRVFHKKI